MEDIFKIKQGDSELLREFMDRFQLERITLPRVPDNWAAIAFTSNLNEKSSEAMRRLKESLREFPTTTWNDVYNSDKGKQAYMKNRQEPPKPPSPKRTVNVISGGEDVNGISYTTANKISRVTITQGKWVRHVLEEDSITFTDADADGVLTPHNDALVISLIVHDTNVKRVLVDPGSSVNIIFLRVLREMQAEDRVIPKAHTLSGFDNSSVVTKGEVILTTFAEGVIKDTKFQVVDMEMDYNMILGRPWIHEIDVVPLTLHQVIKFPSPWGICQIRGDQHISRAINSVANTSMRSEGVDSRPDTIQEPEENENIKTTIEKLEPVVLFVQCPDKKVYVGANLDQGIKGIPPEVITHKLNEDPSYPPVKQKKRKQGAFKNQECQHALRNLKTYLSNPPLLAKPKAGEKLLIYLAVSEVEVFNGANPGTWTLFTDGSSDIKGADLGVVLVPPTGETIQQAIKCHSITNNEAEYEAMIAGLELARELDINQNIIKSDSQLVVNQMLGTYTSREARMQQYLEKVRELIKQFQNWKVRQIPRDENLKVDALANLASAADVANDANASVIHLFHSVLDPDVNEILQSTKAANAGKLSPTWEGPYRVRDVAGKGAYELETMDGRVLPSHWNVVHLKRYYF
ncbi:uncharacterized protein [Nicotiana sylvestris]|uniref:uncharacterized protein n=1 Tax=Nicotiana sylvestris TaxID=4096 RepID=UPI00388C80EB